MLFAANSLLIMANMMFIFLAFVMLNQLFHRTVKNIAFTNRLFMATVESRAVIIWTLRLSQNN